MLTEEEISVIERRGAHLNHKLIWLWVRGGNIGDLKTGNQLNYYSYLLPSGDGISGVIDR